MGEFRKGREEVEDELQGMQDDEIPEGSAESSTESTETAEPATEEESAA
jgi:Sec-independent protein translocase protein TatA